METSIPRRRYARIVSLAAMIALLAMLIPAAAGVALGHNPSASLTCVSGVPTLKVTLSSYSGSYTNKVWVTIDGTHDATYYNYVFGTSFSHTWTLSPST